MIEGSLNSKLPTIWRVEKQMRQAVKSEVKKRHQRESQKKEDTSAPNFSEVAKCYVFSMIRVSGQSKSGSVKAAGAEVGAERRHQKLHAAVAKRKFGSETVKNISWWDHFWKF